MLWLETLRVATIALTLMCASYFDWRFREIDDRLWIVSGVIGAILTTMGILIGVSWEKIILIAASIGVTSAAALGLYYANLYGGADAKALIVISVIMPIRLPDFPIHPFTALYSFTNGLIISVVLPIFFLFYNATRILKGERVFEGFEGESTIRKIFACLIGTLCRDAKQKRFWSPMERRVDGKRKFYFSPFIDVDVEIDRDVMWMTPGIPLLIFITAGFVVSLFFGDIVGCIVRVILGY